MSLTDPRDRHLEERERALRERELEERERALALREMEARERRLAEREVEWEANRPTVPPQPATSAPPAPPPIIEATPAPAASYRPTSRQRFAWWQWMLFTFGVIGIGFVVVVGMLTCAVAVDQDQNFIPVEEPAP